MKKDILLFTTVFFIFSSCVDYTPEELAGTYVNNFDELPESAITPPESPGRKDTLILFKDTTYTSSCFGTSKYRLYKTRGTVYIALSNYEMPIRRKSIFDRKPIFVLYGDMDYYYEKID